MRLIRLHVENFGRLSGFDLDFQDGLNTVLRENGWGKSTLAAFIRVMFYGLEGGRKRDLSENDRLKYKPWNQGHFGGSLEFEAEGKRYLVTRDFGEKDKDGTFRLQDAVTLLDSKDYSERLGEELFGIDRESFEKTSFIDRAGIRYRGINSTIGSKVGSVNQLDDLNNYDAAQELMKNFLNANSPKKKTGELFKLGDEIWQLERDAGNQGLIEARIEGIKISRDQEKEKLEEIKAERLKLQKEQANLAENKGRAINAKRKHELATELESRQQTVKAREEGFGGRIPTREELHDLSGKTEEAEKQSVRLASFERNSESDRFERLKRYFRDGIPGEEEVLTQIENCNVVQDGIQRRTHLEEQEARDAKKLEELTLALQRLDVAEKLARDRRAKERAKKLAVGIAAIAAGVILGVLTLALHLNGLLWIPAALCLLTGIIILLPFLLRRTVQESVPMSEAELIRGQERSVREDLESIRSERSELEGEVRRKEEEIKGFLEGRGISYSRADAENLLYEMKNRMTEYQALLREREEKEMAYQALCTEAEGVQKVLKQTLLERGIGLDAADHAGIKRWIGETLQSLTAYEKERREAQLARSAWEDFCREHPELEDLEAVLSDDEIQEREATLQGRMKELAEAETSTHETISHYNRNLDDAYENAENSREKKERLEALKERRDQEMARYRLVEKTQEYLKTAKEQFIARFMQPIKTAFDGYYELMTNGKGNGSEFQIDANMCIFRKEEGQYHDVEAQSEGYADVIGLCIRMALLDVMYEKERPVVIMDDPFASLDQEHLEGAKRFLREISEKYQILYLTCHETRT